jgi:uncharacterized protein YigA (DUF484 family)
MSTERKIGPGVELPDESAVVEHLIQHPEFFDRHPELVGRLRVPHDSGGAVSLVEKQVSMLRAQNRQLERRLVELLEVARSNDGLVDRMHHLALALMCAADMHDALAGVDAVLRERFGADEVVICLFADPDKADVSPARAVDRKDPALKAFARFLDSGRPQLGRLGEQQLEFLFGSKAEGRVGSAALLPVGRDASLGMIAIGSRRKDRFSPTQGTIFLERLGELVGAALERHGSGQG